VRLTLTVGETVLVDICILEPAAPVEDAAATESWPLHADTATDSSPQPFGFRPTPDPWPPSWE